MAWHTQQQRRWRLGGLGLEELGLGLQELEVAVAWAAAASSLLLFVLFMICV